MIQEVCVCFDRFLAITDSQKKKKKIEKRKNSQRPKREIARELFWLVSSGTRAEISRSFSINFCARRTMS